MEVVDQIYKLRRNFIIIGLTGRTGSGCTTVADVLKTPDVNSLKSNYRDVNSGIIDNNVRKNRIVHNYIKQNWNPFTIIKASDVIFYYALQQDFDTFIQCLANVDIIPAEQSKITQSNTDQAFTEQLQVIKESYNILKEKIEECENYLVDKELNINVVLINKYKKLILHDIECFREELDGILAKTIKKVISKELQVWGNNIRQYNSICIKDNIDEKSPSCLAHKINQFIKMFRAADKSAGNPTLIA